MIAARSLCLTGETSHQLEQQTGGHLVELRHTGGIAAARTMVALTGNPAAIQCRLPEGWDLAPYEGEDFRGSSLRGANLVVPFHEIYAQRSGSEQSPALPQVSYVAFVSQAREQSTGNLAHLHWFAYTEDPADVSRQVR